MSYPHYREGQEDQLGALGLVVNIIVLWNTIYMNAALEQLRKEGFPVNPEDVARLSPLIYDHINFLGRYAFALPDFVASGQITTIATRGFLPGRRLSRFSVPLLPKPRVLVRKT